MADAGIDNYLYERTVDGKTVNFKFYDPFDAANTAEVSLGEKELDGNQPETQAVADMAYQLVSKQMNDKRDAKAQADAVAEATERSAADKRTREAEEDFRANRQDVTVQPAKVEKDGTTVYNTGSVDETPPDTSTKKK